MPAVQEASLTTAVPEQPPIAHDSSSSNISGVTGPFAAPEQEQLYLKSFEERLSFLEMELLKQAVTAPTQHWEPSQLSAAGTAAAVSGGNGNPHSQPAGAAAPMPTAAATAAAARFEIDAMDVEISQSGLLGKAELLDREVLAIAQALLIRKGLPYSADAFASSSSDQQQQRTTRTPSSIWGRRAAMRRLRAKPWRYRERDDLHLMPPGPSPSDKAMMQGNSLPYGYQPNFDASMARSGRGSSNLYRRAVVN